MKVYFNDYTKVWVIPDAVTEFDGDSTHQSESTFHNWPI